MMLEGFLGVSDVWGDREDICITPSWMQSTVHKMGE